MLSSLSSAAREHGAASQLERLGDRFDELVALLNPITDAIVAGVATPPARRTFA